MMRFLLVCEGTSDAPLVSHIRRLLLECGATEPEGNAWTTGRLLSDKVRNGMDRLGSADLLFVHRDADNAGADARYDEIAAAVDDASYDGPWVGIVPVHMTEAWLLLDEQAIRKAVRKPNGTTSLTLPTFTESERRADPKEVLKTALLDASETRGRRRNGIRKSFPNLRRNLLENLAAGGHLEHVSSWTRFRDDTMAVFDQMSGRN